MTEPTTEEREEMEKVLHPSCESCESNPACKASGQCWLCVVLKHDAVLALIRERDSYKTQLAIAKDKLSALAIQWLTSEPMPEELKEVNP